MPRLIAFAMIALGLTACQAGDPSASSAGQTGGTVVFAIPTNFETLLPPAQVNQITAQPLDLIYDYLADVGDSLNMMGDHGFTPRLSDHWTWAKDSLSIAFSLNPAAKWHDGVPVRAADVKFTYKLYVDPAMGSGIASNLTRIDSVTTPDSLTATFWFKQRYPTQFYDATTQMRILPAHILASIPVASMRASDAASHPIGSGRFRFVRWTPNQSVEVVADTANYRGRPLLDRLVWDIAPDYQSALVKLYNGEADMYEVIHPDDVPEVAKHAGLRMIVYPQPAYSFLGFNMKKPLFAEPGVRHAIVMSLDRVSMVRNILDTLGVVAKGPFSRLNHISDTTVAQAPYDTAAANRLLDSLGWKRGKDGMRARGGQKLAFQVLAPSSSKYRVRLASLVQDQLQRVGIAATPSIVEMSVALSEMRGHNFDSYLGSWISDLSPNDPKQTWTTGAIKDGVNFQSYSDPKFDAAIDSGLLDLDPAGAKAHFSHAYHIMVADEPGVWLYEPQLVAAVSSRIHTAPFRPDGWWIHLPQWYIPAGERTARDRVGLAAAR
ncbi:MAG TPA: peptide ABC transporter substrate-binding protein [Gemmatimonadaceae bacterium]|nr:peptide ABC transporter substrate-binding protein [Gemmatimonadaceae bacterium]